MNKGKNLFDICCLTAFLCLGRWFTIVAVIRSQMVVRALYNVICSHDCSNWRDACIYYYFPSPLGNAFASRPLKMKRSNDTYHCIKIN
jgi:hypothetical protein